MKTQRILLIRLSHLGDVVHALPVFHALREAHPAAELAWVTQPEFAGLLEGLPGLATVFCFRRRGGARAWLELSEALSAFAPELVVDAQGNLKSAACALTSGAARRVGPARVDWREGVGALVLTEQAAPARGEHALDRMAALARSAAGPGWSGRLRLDVGLSDEERELGKRRWRALAPAGAGELGAPLVVHLAAPGDVRSWPAEHFAELARALHAARLPALFVSGPGEERLGRELERSLPADELRSHWVGQRGLRELAALCSAGAEHGARFVGCDSGPLHLAAACGLPVTCLSGPQAHLRTGPWPVPGRSSGPHRVLLAGSPPACAPCLRRTCEHPAGPVCMRDIAPEAVLASLLIPTSAPGAKAPQPAPAP